MSCQNDALIFGQIYCILSYDGSREDIIINYTLLLLNFFVASCPLMITNTTISGENNDHDHITYDTTTNTNATPPPVSRNCDTTLQRNDESYMSKRTLYAILSLVFVSAFQIGLCIMVKCAGISIIWCAMAAWIWMDCYYMFFRVRSSPPSSLSTPLLNDNISVDKLFRKIQYHQIIILLIDFMALVYYAIVMEPITTVAHILAFTVLGLPLHSMTEKFATRASTLEQEVIVLPALIIDINPIL